MKATAYPLCWPKNWPRAKMQINSKFRVTLSAALNNVQTQLRRFANDSGKELKNITISSNVTLSDQSPKDGGIAVYFRWDQMDLCIAVDRYRTVTENLQAVALVVDAERQKMRHGGLHVVQAAIRGYLALPPAADHERISPPWWEVLGFNSTEALSLAAAEQRYRELAKRCHPDIGGDNQEFVQISEAIAEARRCLK